MKSLKLNSLAKNALNSKEMDLVVGGKVNYGNCGCACAYANNGGSSSAGNGGANKKGGKHSPSLTFVWRMQEDGSWVGSWSTTPY
ncbi:MAG: TIGR04149 family rSAM-modified RiPP [Bacteroidales bacterium]|jgi:natural product precursor|nr:TIGR04149 family rSAM-modified RiPP [Bacteroidales bacterium]